MSRAQSGSPPRPPRLIRHQLTWKTPTVNIALVQLEGPRPRGKHRSVLGDRDTFAWQSLEEINAREKKAVSIVRALAELKERPDLILFPEYSLPVEHSLKALQTESTDKGIIIIPGADNMRRVGGGPILTETPVIIPQQDPIWVAKREPSQWEYGFVDSPSRPEVHVFSWGAQGGGFWFSVYLCLDLLHAVRDPVYELAGAGLFLVPMCSPDIMTFRMCADLLLRREGGSACVLCNCVGEGSVGQSSVIAITPNRPSVVLPELTESAAVVTIHCDRLVPPKKSPITPVVPIGPRRMYTVYSALGDVKLAPIAEQGEEVVTRGVLNPAIFAQLGKKMRVAFVRTERFGEAAERVRNASFEVLAVLGHHDLMVTHVSGDAYMLAYDVIQKIPPGRTFDNAVERGQNVDAQVESFPFFEIGVFHKVLGVPVDDVARRIFSGPEKPSPTPDDLEALVALATDWNDANVRAETRDLFRERRWILSTTQRQPGHIGAIVAIYLIPAAEDVSEQLAAFATHVLPALVRNQAVTSIYEGYGHRLAINYLLRVTATPEALFELIDSIHSAATNARLLITTSTSLVIRRLANLVLDRAFLDPVLNPEDQRYSNYKYLPNLSPKDQMRFVKLERRKQEGILALYRQVAESMVTLTVRGESHARHQAATNAE